MKRTINGKVWEYNEAMGEWSTDTETVSRSEHNVNIWIRWNGMNNYREGTEHSSMKKAMIG